MEHTSWDDIRVLLAIRRAGSLLGAGRLLSQSTSTIGRRVDALELSTGQKLVHRTQSGTELSADALRLVHLAEGFEQGLLALRRDTSAVARTIRVSVPSGLVTTIARPLIALQRASPSYHIELIGEDQVVDVSKREADVALRLFKSSSNVLVEKHVANLRFSLYASVEYAHRISGRRLQPTEAAAHAFVGLDPRWKNLPHEQWMASLGASRFTFRASAMPAVVEAVRQGLGLSALLDDDAIRAGLIGIATDTAGPTQPLYLVYHRDLRKAPHLRSTVSAIEDYLRTPGAS
jgi:DNA-binding transcriptional LysR family regulator